MPTTNPHAERGLPSPRCRKETKASPLPFPFSHRREEEEIALCTLFPHQVRVYDLTQYEHCPDDVLILGTDGLWDVTSDCEVAATVDRVLSAYEPNDPSR